MAGAMESSLCEAPFLGQHNSTRPASKPRRSSGSTACILSLVLFGLTWIAIVAYAFNKHPTYFADQLSPCSCGDNLAQARAMGCKYDSVAAAWLPAQCRDEENTAEFDISGPGPAGEWTYYTDWDKTDTISLAEIENLPDTGGSFYTTHEWHIQHCLYTFRKIWRAPTTGVIIEHRFDTDAHLKHCGQMFMLRGPLDEVVTGSGVTLHADHIISSGHPGH